MMKDLAEKGVKTMSNKRKHNTDALLRALFPDASKVVVNKFGELEMDIDSKLKKLPPDEMRIVQLRFGLLDGQKHTLAEIGREMGMTSEQVEQIEAQAFGHLRHPDQ
jgi:RNA polymerase sigma factor (sigma-70 family)